MNYASHHGIYPDTSYNFHRQTIDTVYLKKPVKISHLAEVLDIDQKTLEKLNPVYRNKLVPYKNGEKFHVILPDYKWGVFLNNEDSIYSFLSEKMAFNYRKIIGKYGNYGFILIIILFNVYPQIIFTPLSIILSILGLK